MGRIRQARRIAPPRMRSARRSSGDLGREKKKKKTIHSDQRRRRQEELFKPSEEKSFQTGGDKSYDNSPFSPTASMGKNVTSVSTGSFEISRLLGFIVSMNRIRLTSQ
jgi:hypothetical protein